ncbi:methyltransferase domain-containing protein [Leptospira kmetyi]|uniref:SAM-dependent methyltransferase n=1 Tax=Leptospira kmetyi TaxID=408139 RepID=A0ABX4N840_9LEPT|nr:methyltransferase domain-containing protein [Leptospira kmetyi]PJZ29086.1 SAM-dependent methyltransferase [Leptospira kmetyi]PJZ39747.1 SAM-dependent methyltransferase [Leptospira kmetyi]
MSVIRETVKSTLQILKARSLPIGTISNRSNGAIWKKVELTGEKRWKKIRAPLNSFTLNDANLDEKKLGSTSLSSGKESKNFLTNSEHQPLLFTKESFSKRPSLESSLNTKSPEVSNIINRTIISNTVKETKHSLSEAMRGNRNAAGEHETQTNTNHEIKANSIVKIVKEFEDIPLSQKDSEYLDQIRDSLTKNLIPPLIASQISDTISKIPVKEPSIVLKVLRNYISNSLLNYNSKLEKKKFDDSNPIKRTVLATKFRNLADAMTSQIEHKENPPISRQNATRRRSSIAWSMMKDAEKLRKVQAVLKGMSREIEEGILPESLKTIRSKADVECLLHSSNYYRNDEESTVVGEKLPPIPRKIEVKIYKFESRYFFEKKEEIKLNSSNGIYGHTIHWAQKVGLLTKEEYKEALNFQRDYSKSNDFVKLTDLKEIEHINKLKDKIFQIQNNLYAKPATEKSKIVIQINGKPYELYFKNKKHYEYRDTNNEKLLKLGFETYDEVVNVGDHLTQLIKEYSYGGAPTEQEIKIKKLENELIGRKISGFFPTPKSLGKKMIDEAMIERGMDVLEPSAGKGDLSDLIKKEGVEPDTIELNPSLREILNVKGHKLVSSDFLEYNDKKYDRIIMNPPFENGQDIEHVRHAYSLLKPGGILVSVMSEGPFFRSDNKSKNFRDWLYELGGDDEQLPKDSFKGPEAFRQTGVSTRLVTIKKD